MAAAVLDPFSGGLRAALLGDREAGHGFGLVIAAPELAGKSDYSTLATIMLDSTNYRWDATALIGESSAKANSPCIRAVLDFKDHCLSALAVTFVIHSVR